MAIFICRCVYKPLQFFKQGGIPGPTPKPFIGNLDLFRKFGVCINFVVVLLPLCLICVTFIFNMNVTRSVWESDLHLHNAVEFVEGSMTTHLCHPGSRNYVNLHVFMLIKPSLASELLQYIAKSSKYSTTELKVQQVHMN